MLDVKQTDEIAAMKLLDMKVDTFSNLPASATISQVYEICLKPEI